MFLKGREDLGKISKGAFLVIRLKIAKFGMENFVALVQARDGVRNLLCV